MEKKIEVNIITIENGKEYLIIDAIVNDKGKYLVLVNENNKLDMCVRKVLVKEGKEFITKLDTEEELDEVINEFYKRHNKGKENINEE